MLFRSPTAAGATVDTVAACEIPAVPGPLLWPAPPPARHREPAFLQRPEPLTCAKHLPQPPKSGFYHSQLEPDGDRARSGRYGRVGQAARVHRGCGGKPHLRERVQDSGRGQPPGDDTLSGRGIFTRSWRRVCGGCVHLSVPDGVYCWQVGLAVVPREAWSGTFQ